MGSAAAKQTFLQRILRSIAGYGFGGALPPMIGFFLIPIYTRFLTTADYGTVDLASAIGAVLYVFLRLGMCGAVTRFYYDFKSGPEHEFASYLSSVLGFLLVWSAVVGVLASVVGVPLFSVIAADVAFSPFVLLAIWTAVFNVPSDLLRRVLQVREQAQLYSVLTIGRFLLSTSIVILMVVVFEMGALGVMLGPFVDAAVFFAVSMYMLRGYLTWDFRWSAIVSSATYGLPMVLHHFAGQLLTLADRFLLGNMASLGSLGIYGVGFRFALPLQVVGNALNLAWSPVYFDARKGGHEDLRDNVGSTFTTIWAGLVGLWIWPSVLGKEVVELLLPPEYHDAYRVIPWLAGTHVLGAVGTMISSELFYSKKTWFVPVATVTAGAANLGANIFLIPRFGAVGAAAATAAARLLLVVLNWWFSRRLWRWPIEVIRCLIIGLLAAASLVLSELVGAANIVDYWPWVVKVTLLIVVSGCVIAVAVAGRTGPPPPSPDGESASASVP